MLRQMMYHVGQAAMHTYAETMLDMNVRYASTLPAGPKIFAANHPTTLDPFLLLTVTREEVSILVTEFCFRLPVFGRYLHSAGHIRVVHSNGRPAFDEAVQRLRDGQSVGIFPSAACQPVVIIVGLHLSHVSGNKVLGAIRQAESLAQTRMSITTADATLTEVLRRQSDLVLIKPISFLQLRDLAKRLRAAIP